MDKCCQTCDGAVYPGGSVISVQTEGGQCGATVTTECVSYGNSNVLVVQCVLHSILTLGDSQPSKIEQTYSHTECCVGQEGIL